jgi:hypothetical protein
MNHNSAFVNNYNLVTGNNDDDFSLSENLCGDHLHQVEHIVQDFKNDGFAVNVDKL